MSHPHSPAFPTNGAVMGHYTTYYTLSDKGGVNRIYTKNICCRGKCTMFLRGKKRRKVGIWTKGKSTL